MSHTTTRPTATTPSRTATPEDHPQDGALVRTTVRQGPARQVIDEWNRIAQRRATIRRVNAWEFLPRPVEDLNDLLILCGFSRPVDDSVADQLLWHVVRRAAHDDLAAQVVLHRVMPSLLAIARRRGRLLSGGTQAALSEVLPSAWMVIRTYPCERRPAKVAANIVRDSEYMAFVRPHRLRRVEETAVDDEKLVFMLPTDDPWETTTNLDDVLLEAEDNGVDHHHTNLLRELASGRNGEDIAGDIGVSARTIRNRRRAAIDAVRASLHQPVEA